MSIAGGLAAISAATGITPALVLDALLEHASYCVAAGACAPDDPGLPDAIRSRDWSAIRAANRDLLPAGAAGFIEGQHLVAWLLRFTALAPDQAHAYLAAERQLPSGWTRDAGGDGTSRNRSADNPN